MAFNFYQMMRMVIPASIISETLPSEQLLRILRKYSRNTWLNALSRAQSICISDRLTPDQKTGELFNAFFSHRLRVKILKAVAKLPVPVKIGLVTQDGLCILQQLAILHCGDRGKDFVEEEDYDDLGRVILNISDAMYGGNISSLAGTLEANNELVVDLLKQVSRIDQDEWWQTFSRGFEQWGFSGNQTVEASQLLEELKQITGISASEYFLGGFAIFLREMSKSKDDLRRGWIGTLDSQNPQVQSLVEKYQSVHSANAETIRREIEKWEKVEDFGNWNFLPLRTYPIIEIGRGHFVMSSAAIAETLLHGIYHQILRGRLAAAGSDDDARKKAAISLGEVYGHLFEKYIESKLRESFHEKLFKIPESKQNRKKRCDFALLEDNKLVLIECKSRRKNAIKFYACTKMDHMVEVVKSQLGESVVQISHTIEDLKSGRLIIPGLESSQVDSLTILPLTICEEPPPTVPLSWERLYHRFDDELNIHRTGAMVVGHLRWIAPSDLFYFENFLPKMNLSSLLLESNKSEANIDFGFKNFLLNQGISLPCPESKKIFYSALERLAQGIGMQWKIPDWIK